MKNNLISIIIPVFNTGKYISQAISSVLRQTYKDIELICVNDGSTDNTLEILKSFGEKIKILNFEKNKGTSIARNEGIRLASGEYLAFLDADDIWYEKKLEVQMKDFTDDPDLDISFTYLQNFFSEDTSDEFRKLHLCPEEPISGQIPSTVVVKKSSFDRVGYFSTEFKNGDFLDWMLKARGLGLKEKTNKEVLVERRIHETNSSIVNPSISRDDYLKIVKRALDNKKKSNN